LIAATSVAVAFYISDSAADVDGPIIGPPGSSGLDAAIVPKLVLLVPTEGARLAILDATS